MPRDYQIINPAVTDLFGAQLVALQPIAGQGTLTLDSTWAPYAQGTVVCAPPSGADLTKIDPRLGVRLAATMRQIDTDTGAVLNRPLNLAIRARSRAYVGDAGEVLTLTVTSDESLMQDWASENGLGPISGMTGYDLCNYALNQAYPNVAGQYTFTAEAGAPTGALAAAAMAWDPGTSAWDYMAAMTEAAGAWLYCDEVRGWHFAAPGWTADTAVKTITDTDHIVGVTDTIDRADPSFGNYVLVSYTGDTPATMVSSNGGVVPRKTLSLTRPRKQPAGNAATRIRTAAQKRGRTLTVDALAEIYARPNQTWKTTYQGVTWTAACQAVTLDLSTGLMNMRLNVIES